MIDFNAILSAANQLSVAERLRLIDAIASTVPNNEPPSLSEEWLAEIDRRSNEIDSGNVKTESWEDIRQRLYRKAGR